MIRTVHVSKDVYNRLLYPGVASATNKTTAELRIQNRILEKLEHCGKPRTTIEDVLCERCQSNAANASNAENRPPPLYVLNGIGAEFKFEEQEVAYILEKLTEHLPRVQGRLARAMIPMLDALEKTEELDELGLAESAKVQTEKSEEVRT